jgi:AcrR family transcriptional regulator
MSKKASDPRVIRTRKLLRESLMRLLRERNFDTITIQHITDGATLNRATFYLHFADKHELLLHTMQEILDELTLLPAPVSPKNPNWPEPERLQVFFTEVFRHVAEHSAFYSIMLGNGSLAAFVTTMQDYIEQIGLKWLARARREILIAPPEIMVCVVAGAYMGMIRWWLKTEMRHPPEYMAEQFMRLVLPGILPIVANDK